MQDNSALESQYLTGRRLEAVWIVLVAAGAFGLYAATAVPGVFDGDYGEFQYLPRVLGVPHPTGYPLFLLLGWLWSWLPLGSQALRMNLFSTVWAAVTLALVYWMARTQRLRRIAAVAGAVTLGFTPAFWQYSGLAAVYTLHPALLAGALACWLQWAQAPPPADRKWLQVSALLTGLSLTNHPTAAFLVPAAAVSVMLQALPRHWPARSSSSPWEANWRKPAKRLKVGELLAATALFALPGLLYLYVPLRVCTVAAGEQGSGLRESAIRGLISPYVTCDARSVVKYITGRSLLGGYGVDVTLLWQQLPSLLVDQLGMPLVLLAAFGSLIWLLRRPRSWLVMATLGLPAALYAATYAANFTSRGQVAHLEGHLLPALLILGPWMAQGTDSAIGAVSGLWPRPERVQGLALVLLVGVFGLQIARGRSPTSAMCAQSRSIERYWRQVLSYPLEEGAALAAHWGDLTAFWYFQHGEGLRSDLRGVHPPYVPLIDEWLARSDRPIYLAGPALVGHDELLATYDLTPWGALVRVQRPGEPVALPALTARTGVLGEQLELQGFGSRSVETGRWQVWLTWNVLAPTRSDLSISIRLHGPDGSMLGQEDGRLASAWYPSDTLPAGQAFLTILEMKVCGDVPPGTTATVAVYDPQTVEPLETAEGQRFLDLGPFRP